MGAEFTHAPTYCRDYSGLYMDYTDYFPANMGYVGLYTFIKHKKNQKYNPHNPYKHGIICIITVYSV